MFPLFFLSCCCRCRRCCVQSASSRGGVGRRNYHVSGLLLCLGDDECHERRVDDDDEHTKRSSPRTMATRLSSSAVGGLPIFTWKRSAGCTFCSPAPHDGIHWSEIRRSRRRRRPPIIVLKNVNQNTTRSLLPSYKGREGGYPKVNELRNPAE